LDKRFRAARESHNLLDWAVAHVADALAAKGHYLMENADSRGEVSIRRYNNNSECDVIVAIRGREMVVRPPNYSLAMKWARMESRSYKLPAEFSEEAPGLRAKK
jgi:hypothetical protein